MVLLSQELNLLNENCYNNYRLQFSLSTYGTLMLNLPTFTFI